jgi:hypothetical protein
MAMDAAEVERDAFDRAGLLVGRLEGEALPDAAAVHGAAYGEGGLARLYNADSVLNAALRRPAGGSARAGRRRELRVRMGICRPQLCERLY